MYPFKLNDIFMEIYHHLVQIRQNLDLTSSSEIIKNAQNKMSQTT